MGLFLGQGICYVSFIYSRHINIFIVGNFTL